MNGNEGYWGGGISIISQNFPKSPSILFHPLYSSISQTSPKGQILYMDSSKFCTFGIIGVLVPAWIGAHVDIHVEKKEKKKQSCPFHFSPLPMPRRV
jgi:hypothetical protein